jgi:hypothetical protein
MAGSFGGENELFSGRRFKAVIDMRGAIPRKHLCLVGLVTALHRPQLFGTPLLRGLAEFGRNAIGFNELLGEARSGEHQRRNNNQTEK